MMAAVVFLGQSQTQITLYSGAIQIIKEIMDDSLAEKPSSSGDASPPVELKPLSKSLELSHIRFRYSPKLPDVIKDFGVSVGKGEYLVLMGGSGSGKSTVSPSFSDHKYTRLLLHSSSLVKCICRY